MAAIPLRGDFNAATARAAARATKEAGQARHLLALAAIYDGASRADAAKLGGVTVQIVRDWVLKFNAAGPAGLIDRKAPGQPRRLTAEHRAALAAMIESGPIPAVHGVVRWRQIDLCQWLWEEFRVPVDRRTLGREMREMGFRKLSARPRHHAQCTARSKPAVDHAPIRQWITQETGTLARGEAAPAAGGGSLLAGE